MNAIREPILVCWSGGKDSALALHELQRDPAVEIVALLTTVTAGFDRVSMHGVRRELLHVQAASLGLPLEEVAISMRPSNDEYEARMGAAFSAWRSQGVRRVAFGDIFLADLREYRERLLTRHGLAGLYPLWGRDTRELAYDFVARGFRAVTVCVDPRTLTDDFAGRAFDADFLADLPAGCDPCGENGEFHTFTHDGPNFATPVRFRLGATVRRDSFSFRDLLSEANEPLPTPV